MASVLEEKLCSCAMLVGIDKKWELKSSADRVLGIVFCFF
jgi:hypothetical protein